MELVGPPARSQASMLTPAHPHDLRLRAHATERLRASSPIRYAVAILSVAVAMLVRWLLDPLLGDSQPLSLLFGAIALTVWFGGYKPAIFATVLGYVAADYLFTEPRGEIAIHTAQQLIGFITYLLSSGIVIAFGEALARMEARSRRYVLELECKGRELERAQAQKDEFLATLAHELRTPLSAVRNAVLLLRRKFPMQARAVDACGIIDRQTTHVIRLVDDLLDVSRIAAGRLDLHKSRIDLNSALTLAVETVHPSIVQARHRLHFVTADPPLHVHGDFARVTQVFINLLNNAIRYTPANGRIEVTIERHADEAVIVVRDSGIGIPRHMLGRIFNLFERSDLALKHSNQGLGIGLALVRRIIELHDGTVEARSNGPGTGSEFIVCLRLAEADLAPECTATTPSNTPRTGKPYG
jgi:signal transduction histidine kinase